MTRDIFKRLYKDCLYILFIRLLLHYEKKMTRIHRSAYVFFFSTTAHSKQSLIRCHCYLLYSDVLYI